MWRFKKKITIFTIFKLYSNESSHMMAMSSLTNSEVQNNIDSVIVDFLFSVCENNFFFIVNYYFTIRRSRHDYCRY